VTTAWARAVAVGYATQAGAGGVGQHDHDVRAHGSRLGVRVPREANPRHERVPACAVVAEVSRDANAPTPDVLPE
jgi:hypothetical protein